MTQKKDDRVTVPIEAAWEDQEVRNEAADRADEEGTADQTTQQQPDQTTEQPIEEIDWKALYDEEHEKYLRAVAELQNYRRRATEDMSRQRRYANENLIAELLPVTDNCCQAADFIGTTDDVEQIATGVDMIIKQLLDFLARQGVTLVETCGVDFDPARHEAVQAVQTDDVPPNTVVEVVQPGYMLNDRLLRAAKVRVAVRTEEGNSTTEEN